MKNVGINVKVLTGLTIGASLATAPLVFAETCQEHNNAVWEYGYDALNGCDHRPPAEVWPCKQDVEQWMKDNEWDCSC